MRIFINSVGFIVILVLMLMFAMENTTKVTLNYYFGSLECSVFMLVLIPFFLGVLAGNLLDVFQRFRMKNEIRNLKRQLKEASPPQ
jgi:uncharacterized integral membrane protein